MPIRVANSGKLVPRGEYSADALYSANNVVSYEGYSYIVLQPCTGVTPAAGEYYMLNAAVSNSDLIAEGVNNLYHTNDRVNALIEAKIVNLDEATNGQILTSNGDGTSTFVESNSDLIEPGEINKYFTAEEKAAIQNGTAINDGAITPNKTSFFDIIPSKNLFTSNWENGQIVGATGAESDSINFMRTDEYISVDPSSIYTVKFTGLSSDMRGYKYQYDANKTILSYSRFEISSHHSFTTGEATAFVRFCTYRNTAPAEASLLPTTSQFERGALPTEYISSDPTVFYDLNFVDVVNMQKKINLINAESKIYLSSPIFVHNRNLFHTTWESGQIDGTTGGLIASTKFGRTVDYLNILPSTNYTLNCTISLVPQGIYVYLYDANKNYISKSQKYNSSELSFTSAANAAYVKFGIWYNTEALGVLPSQTQWELGGKTDYVAPGFYIADKYINFDAIVQSSQIATMALEQSQWENAYIKKIAHRGYSMIAPENTAPAYIRARQKGFQYAEGDIWFTIDGVPVLNHLETIDEQSNGTGNIEELTIAYLQTLDFGSWKGVEYTGTPILTYEGFLRLCKKLGLCPYMDLKSAVTPERASVLINIASKLGMLNKITWLGSLSSLDNIRTLDNKARIGTVSYNAPADLTEWVNRITEPGNVFLNLQYDAITQGLSDLCTTNGVGLEAWIVNDETILLNLSEMNVQGITTDGLSVGKILMDSVL